MKTNTVRTFIKYNTKIVEIGKIDIPNTHDRSHFWLCTGTSITRGSVNYFIGPNLPS